jgi:hypothetical protein
MQHLHYKKMEESTPGLEYYLEFKVPGYKVKQAFKRHGSEYDEWFGAC